MSSNTEQFGAILNIKYIGNEQVQQYIQALQQAGAITESQGSRISGALGLAAQSGFSFSDAMRAVLETLNLSKTAVADISKMFDRLAASQSSATTNKLATDYERLDRVLAGATVRADSLRLALARVTAGNLAVQQLAAPQAAQVGVQQSQLARVQVAAQALPALPAASPTTVLAGRLFERTGDVQLTLDALKGLGFSADQGRVALESVRVRAEALARITAAQASSGEQVTEAQQRLAQAYAALAERMRALAAGSGPQLALTQTSQRAQDTALLQQQATAYQAARPTFQPSRFAVTPGGTTFDLGSTLGQNFASIDEQIRSYVTSTGKAANRQVNATVRRAQQQAAANFNQQQFLSSLGAGGGNGPIDFGQVLTGGGGGGFGQNFGQGFTASRGGGSQGIAYQLGQTAKFTLFYGAMYSILFKVSQAFAAARNEAEEFQKALVELDIVTERTSAQNAGLADQLGHVAAQAGSSPSAGVQVGANAIGLYQAQGQSYQQQAAVAEVAAKTSTQLAYLTGRKASEVQLDLGAITSAFNLGYGGQVTIQDVDAYITRKFGLKPGSTIQTTAEIGTTASSAGYGLEQTTAIAALLQARSGQTPAAVAGFLSQIFGKGTDAGVQSQFAKYGISQSGDTLAEQYKQLAALHLPTAELNQFADAVSKGRAGGAIRALLQDYAQVLQVADQAKTKSVGAGQQQFEAQLGTLGGQSKQLAGAAAELAKDLGTSGLLDIFGLLIVTTKNVFEALDGVVKLFNELPRGLRDTAIAAAALAVATRVGAFSGIATRLGEAAGLYRAESLATRTPLLVNAAGATQAAGRLGTTAALGGAAVRGGAIGAAVGTLVNPITLAIGGLIAIGELKQSSEELKIAMTQATGAQSELAKAITSQDYLTAAHDLANARGAVQKASGGVFGSLASGDEGTIQASRLAGQEALALQSAKRVAQDEQLAESMRKVGVFGDPAVRTVDSVNTTLTNLANSGASAAERVRLLNAALSEVGSAPGGRTPVRTNQVASYLASGLTGLEKKSSDRLYLPGPGGVAVPTQVNPLNDLFSKNGTAIADAVSKSLPTSVGVSGQLDPAAKQKLIDSALAVLVPQYQKQLDELSPAGRGRAETVGDFRKIVTDKINAMLKGYNVGAGIKPGTKFSSEELTGYVATTIQQYQALIAELDPGDLKGQISVLQKELAQVNSLISHHAPDADLTLVLAQKAQLERQVAETTVAGLEQERKALQNRARSTAQLKSIGNQYFAKEALVYLAAGDTGALIDLINRANTQEVAAVRISLQTSLDVVNAAIAAARHTAALALEAGGEFHGNAAGEISGVAGQAKDKQGRLLTQQQKQTQQQLDLLNKAAGLSTPDRKGKGDLAGGAGSNSPYADTGKDAAKATDTAAQIAAAAAAARAARVGGQIAAAKAQIQTAAADLAAATRGTREYYQALASYYQAQAQLRDAILADQKVKLQLSSDITNPVAQAGIELKSAQAKLTSDRKAGQAPDVIRADQLAVRQAQASAENVAFQQQIQDVQTNEQLGRISHVAYIRYLQNQHDRLQAISHRTRQQQDELNQVDGLLQAAKQQMQGQFNLGNIKLPTVYEVRRYIQESAKAAQAVASSPAGPTRSVGSNVSINITGTDTGAVLQVLSKYLGPQAISATAVSATRKV